MEKQKLAVIPMIGYSIGSMVRVVENVFAFYFVYYLTTVAGVGPAVAGGVSSGVVLWAACISPFIGHFADKQGRRRKLVLFTMAPMAVLLFLLFSSFDLGVTGSVVYYAVIGCLCYTSFYLFLIPYDSLGADLTESYDTRSVMRGLCTGFLYLSGIVGGTLTLFLQGYFAGNGVSTGASWQYAILLSCILIIVAGLSAWRSTRYIDKPVAGAEQSETLENKNIFRSYAEMLKMKPFVALTVWCLLYFTGTTLLATDIVYLGIFNLGLSEAAASLFFTVSTVATFIAIPPMTALINKFGKKRIMVLSMFVLIIVGVIVLIKGPTSYLDGWAIMIAYAVTNSTVLITSFSMLYDVGELTEIVIGQKKVTTIVGAFTFAMALAQSIAYALFGGILQIGGFDAEAAEQSDKALNTILYSATIIPAVLVLLSVLVLGLYKINKNNFNALLEAIEKKNNGEEYSTEGFKELL